jgi:hypothetical protein
MEVEVSVGVRSHWALWASSVVGKSVSFSRGVVNAFVTNPGQPEPVLAACSAAYRIFFGASGMTRPRLSTQAKEKNEDEARSVSMSFLQSITL